MTRTQEELMILKEEYETVRNKLAELNEEELMEVAGGGIKIIDVDPKPLVVCTNIIKEEAEKTGKCPNQGLCPYTNCRFS